MYPVSCLSCRTRLFSAHYICLSARSWAKDLECYIGRTHLAALNDSYAQSASIDFWHCMNTWKRGTALSCIHSVHSHLAMHNERTTYDAQPDYAGQGLHVSKQKSGSSLEMFSCKRTALLASSSCFIQTKVCRATCTSGTKSALLTPDRQGNPRG